MNKTQQNISNGNKISWIFFFATLFLDFLIILLLILVWQFNPIGIKEFLFVLFKILLILTLAFQIYIFIVIKPIFKKLKKMLKKEEFQEYSIYLEELVKDDNVKPFFISKNITNLLGLLVIFFPLKFMFFGTIITLFTFYHDGGVANNFGIPFYMTSQYNPYLLGSISVIIILILIFWFILSVFLTGSHKTLARKKKKFLSENDWKNVEKIPNSF